MQDRDKKAIAVGAGLAVAAALIWVLRVRGQEPDKASLSGYVTDYDNEPISGINVDCNGYSSQTNINGYYRISNIEPGTYTVVFTDPYDRYLPHTE